MADRRTYTPQELSKALRQAPGAIARRLAPAFRLSGEEFKGKMRLRFTGRPGLFTRTGFLHASIGYEVSGDGNLDALTLRAFSAGTKYARLQEKGGTIRPVKAKYLTIPIEDNLTAAGVPRYPSAAALMAQGDTFVFKAKTGGLYIVRRGNSGELEFLWKLVKQVTVPPRLGFFSTWKDLSKPRTKRIRDAIAVGVKDAIGAGG